MGVGLAKGVEDMLYEYDTADKVIEQLMLRGMKALKMPDGKMLITHDSKVVGVINTSYNYKANYGVYWLDDSYWKRASMTFAEQFICDNEDAFDLFNICDSRRELIKEILDIELVRITPSRVFDHIIVYIYSNFSANNSNEHVERTANKLKNCETYSELLDILAFNKGD